MDFFTAQTVVEEPFLFISYSHEDKAITHGMAQYLLEKGVRFWFDKDLAAGDPWPNVVETLITHPNCRGIIFVCSPAAYLSKNVHKERALALTVQQERGAAQYSFFLVNVCENLAQGSYMNLLKAAFERVSAESIGNVFPIEFLNTLMKIIGPDPLCVMSASEQWCEELLEDGICRRALETVDKGLVALGNMKQSVGFGEVAVKIGNYNGPLKWQLISREGETGVFLLQSILSSEHGKGLEKWLNETFRRAAFSEAEEKMLIGDIRLLTEKEAQNVSKSILQAESAWWLRDCIGARQAEVKPEGVVNKLRQLNHQFKRGVRPVIVLNLEEANRLINE